MTILTTLSPTNLENQKRAINSWLSFGYSVKSFNSKSDIDKLGSVFEVEFIETSELGSSEFKKDYVRLNAFTGYIKNNGSCIILNSDIEISGKLPIKKSDKSIVILSRNDYDKSFETAKKFESGFDGFYITKEFAYYVPISRLVIGQCHWDYFLPILAIKYGFNLYSPLHSNMYHKCHQIQYNTERWRQTGRIFAMELGLSGNVSKDSKESYTLIKSKIEYYEL